MSFVNLLAVGQENYPQALEDYSFDEDSSDALSPDQPASQESQGSAASPGEPKPSDSPSPVIPNTISAAQVQFLMSEPSHNPVLHFCFVHCARPKHC